MHVFISGPLTNGDRDYHTNVIAAARAASDVSALGHAVSVPHCLGDWQLVEPVDYETWMDRAFRLIDHADVLYRIGANSPGADREEDYAVKKGVPVVYSLEALVSLARQRGE